jgi:hypothetical protein
MDPALEAEPERLRALTRGAAFVLLASCLVPVETPNDGARSLAALLSDVRPASLVVLLAPAAAGLALLVAARRARAPGVLAAWALVALVGLGLVWAQARAVLAWDLLPEPSWLGAGPALALGAVAAAVAGASLASRPHLALAAALAIVQLFTPSAGEAPLPAIARALPHVARRSGAGNLLAAVVLSLAAAWPAVATLAAWAWPRRSRERAPSLLALSLGLGAPLVFAPLLTPSLLDPWRAASAVTALGALVVLGPLVVLAPAALVGAHRALRPRLALGPAAALLVVGLATWLAARPPRGPSEWPLDAATAAGDRLFGALVPAWNDAGADDAARGAEATALARELDAGLGEAMGALVREAGASRGATLGEGRFYRLVAAVNDASRAARLPYYLDPTALVGTLGELATRRARVDGWRIERVRRTSMSGRDVVTLHVRALAPGRPRYGALGVSRDLQPFAVVELDEVEAYAAELARIAARRPARCRDAPGETPRVEEALLACGEALAALAAAGDLADAVLETTDRHELQHQLDGPDLQRSAWLVSRTPWAEEGHRRRLQREARAYLAQLGTVARPPALTLVRLVRLAALSRAGVEHDAATLALESLAGGAPRGFADAFLAVRGLDDDELRRRAREGCARLGPAL